MLKVKLTSLMILGMFFCCPLSFAEGIQSVCCSGQDMTMQKCCEDNGGLWCDTDQSCVKLMTDAIFESPCINEQACTDFYSSWCDDPGIHRCFSDYYEFLVSGCSTATKAKCNNTNNKLRWCDIEGKEGCYFYNMMREPRYSTHCTD